MTDNGQYAAGETLVPLNELAEEVGTHPNGFHKAVRRRGFVPVKRRQTISAPWYVTESEATRFKKMLDTELKNKRRKAKNMSSAILSGVYAIEVPSFDGEPRFKVGWSGDIHDRLAGFRTIIPDLRVHRIWLGEDKWLERMILKWSETNCVAQSPEVFEITDISKALTELDGLLASLGISPMDSQQGSHEQSYAAVVEDV